MISCHGACRLSRSLGARMAGRTPGRGSAKGELLGKRRPVGRSLIVLEAPSRVTPPLPQFGICRLRV